MSEPNHLEIQGGRTGTDTTVLLNGERLAGLVALEYSVAANEYARITLKGHMHTLVFSGAIERAEDATDLAAALVMKWPEIATPFALELADFIIKRRHDAASWRRDLDAPPPAFRADEPCG